nr:hypothetical protein [Lachnospiraceae bacterium]
KGARKAFLLSQGKLCFAKMLLAPHMSLLRITLGGAAAPPNLPEFSDSPISLSHKHFGKTIHLKKSGNVAEFFCSIPILFMSVI